MKLSLLLFLIFNIALIKKATAQHSDLFVNPVKRGVLKSDLPKTDFKFNTTIKTTANKPSDPSNLITDGQDVRVFPSANVQAEVHISVNKQNPNNLIASCNTYQNTYNQGYYYSFDAGNTWNGGDQLQNSPAVLYGDPSTAFSANGSAYITTIDPQGGYLSQSSTNGGVNWSNLISGVNEAGFDKMMIASDNTPGSPFANNVYAAWTNFDGGITVEFNRSTNNGASYTNPIVLRNGFGQGTNVQTGPNGEVYVCWADYDNGQPTSRGLGFCSSFNGGVNFTPYQRVLSYTGIRIPGTDPNFNNIRVNDFPAMAVDKSNGPHRGRIYVVLPVKENGNGKAIIQLSFSDNQGITWSTPATISIPGGRQNWFPWITVDDCSGDVWATYYSFDTPSGFTTNTYVAHSVDGGSTWENQKVSDVGHTTAPINNNLFATGYSGDYIGITAFQGRAYPIWMDDRNGTWQLYCSPVTASYTINGDNNLCLNSTSTLYSIIGLPAGAFVHWDATPSGAVTINSPNSPQTTITANTNGSCTLTATITTNCGGPYTATPKTITLGLPFVGGTYTNTFDNSINPLGYYPYVTNPACTGYYIRTNMDIIGATWVNWSKISSNGVVLFNQVYNPNDINFYLFFSGEYAVFQLDVSNGCGTVSKQFKWQASNCGGGGGGGCNAFTVSPNPSQGRMTIRVPNIIAPCLTGNATTKALVDKNLKIAKVNVYDLSGSSIIQAEAKNVKEYTIDLSRFIRGSYYVEIIGSNGYKEKQLVIVQK